MILLLPKKIQEVQKKCFYPLIKLKINKEYWLNFPKKKQDLRADLPTIGLDTIKDCKKANLKGLVLKANQNIFLDKVKSVIFANKNKIFITIKWKKYLF